MLNKIIFNFFYSLAHQSAAFDRIVRFAAVSLPYFVIVAAVAFLFFYLQESFTIKAIPQAIVAVFKKWRVWLPVVLSVSIAWALAEGLKIVTHVPRPFVGLAGVTPLFPETGFSFPSQHTIFFAALGASIYFINRRAGYIFMALALLVGIARIIGGVHYPIDIFAGLILGVLVAGTVKYCVRS